jgi:hypothetical protein
MQDLEDVKALIEELEACPESGSGKLEIKSSLI